MANEGVGTLDWSVIVALVIHPTKVQIVSAIEWIDRPLSASELENVLDGGESMSSISYHLKSLASLGVLRRAGSQQVRGAWKRLYAIAPAVRPRAAD